MGSFGMLEDALRSPMRRSPGRTKETSFRFQTTKIRYVCGTAGGKHGRQQHIVWNWAYHEPIPQECHDDEDDGIHVARGVVRLRPQVLQGSSRSGVVVCKRGYEVADVEGEVLFRRRKGMLSLGTYYGS